MALGNIDRSPPPFFRQGLSALTKLGLCAALAVFLMAADRRLRLVEPLRAALATALLPVQRVLMMPVDLVNSIGAHAQGLRQAIANENAAQARLAAQAERAARAEQLSAENKRLRALLELRPALQVRSISAEVMYEASDPFSRKVFIDRGATHGVLAGAPVINDAGVLGQVTRVYPLTAVVTLLSDKDATMPVLNARTQQRCAAFGGAEGGMELRFLAGNADVQVGDLLVTGGIDGVYPAALPVARVTQVDRRAESGFARVLATPVAPIDGVHHVLVLEPVSAQLPPRPDEVAPEAPRPSRGGKGTRP
jgi:rod shape-determining protein MreC